MDEIEKMEALQQMLQQEGWPLVEQFIRERVVDSRNRLMTCELKDVIEHRARIKALNSVFLFITETIEKGEEARQTGG